MSEPARATRDTTHGQEPDAWRQSQAPGLAVGSARSAYIQVRVEFPRRTAYEETNVTMYALKKFSDDATETGKLRTGIDPILRGVYYARSYVAGKHATGR